MVYMACAMCHVPHVGVGVGKASAIAPPVLSSPSTFCVTNPRFPPSYLTCSRSGDYLSDDSKHPKRFSSPFASLLLSHLWS